MAKISVQIALIYLTVLLVADFIVVGSDSGRIVILEYLPGKNAFEKVVLLIH